MYSMYSMYSRHSMYCMYCLHCKYMYCKYYNRLWDLPIYMIPPMDEDYVPWFVDIYTESRDELAAFLKIHNIQTRPTYPAVHTTPMYESDASNPVTSYVSRTGLFLPSHTLITEGEIEHICRLIRCFYGGAATGTELPLGPP